MSGVYAMSITQFKLINMVKQLHVQKNNEIYLEPLKISSSRTRKQNIRIRLQNIQIENA